VLETDPRVADALEGAVPRYDAERGDWDAVAAAAGRRRRRPRLALALAPASAALLVLVLAWPFGGDRGGVLERALAAVGDGPVLHVVLREEWTGRVVDLRTGEETPAYREREVWFDPDRGLHEVVRFGGETQSDVVYRPREIRVDLLKTLRGLHDGYRRALKKGAARVVGQGRVDGIPVHWIQVEATILADPDGTRHVWERVVAVSRKTFEPVYVDERADGRPGPETGLRILAMDSFPAGEGDFTGRPPTASRPSWSRGAGRLALAELPAFLGRQPLWLGDEFAGLGLVSTSASRVGVGAPGASRSAPELMMFYGSESGGHIDRMRPHLVLAQSTDVDMAFPTYAAGHFRSGEIVVMQGKAFVRRDGVYVVIYSRSEDLLLAAARALRPLP
jgi:hypothetical protein